MGVVVPRVGDPSRIVILNLLATAGRPMSVGEIVDELDLAQSTVSHHLKILGEVGSPWSIGR